MPKPLRWEVPIDGKYHIRTFKGDVTTVNLVLSNDKKSGFIEFWTFEYWSEDDPAVEEEHVFIAFTTGQEVPPGHVLVGTTHPETGADLLGLGLTNKEKFVYHLFEKMV